MPRLRCLPPLACLLFAVTLHAQQEPAATPTEKITKVEAEPTPAVAAPDRPLASWFQDRTPTELLRTFPGYTEPSLRFDGSYIGGYAVIDTHAVPLPADAATRLQQLVAAPAAFEPTGKKKCVFRPGVACRFGGVDLLVCFACDEAAIVPSGKDVAAMFAFGQATRDILLGIAKELLPDDEAIQSLPKIRSDQTAPPPPVPVPDLEPKHES